MAITRSLKLTPQLMALVLCLAAACTLTSCASPKLRELTEADVQAIGALASCDELQLMEGEPSYYGPAEGFNCFNADSSEAVFLRYYEDSGAVEKTIIDWDAAIEDAQAVAYGKNWIAIGPEPVLMDLLGPFSKSGPTRVGPPGAPMTADESKLSQCSSMVYEILLASATGTPDTSLQNYFDTFSGLNEFRDEILTKDHEEELAVASNGDDLRGTVYLTKFDKQIKEFCSGSLP